MAKVVIDAGHGGIDSGAVGNGIIEKDLNLKISKYIYDRLKDLGIDVKLTRDTDETLSPTERVNRVLNAFGNSSDVLVISNHINAGGGDGAEVIYALRNKDTLSNLILSELEKEGQNIRRSYQRRLPNDTTKDYYFMQRNTGNTEAITIEYGFLDSKGDDVNQLKQNWQNYAEAVVRAILEYLNLTYISTDENGYYKVKIGDTLWNIARTYLGSWTKYNMIMSLNNLQNETIYPGQILKIPLKNQNNIYTVQPGDNLWNISLKLLGDGNRLYEIIKLNNLQSDQVTEGQTLKIPEK